MKVLPLLLCAPLLLAGCRTMPDPTDTTNARIRFRIHYQAPGLTTPNVEILATSSVQANRCLYVATPFGVVVNAGDEGGIRSIYIGPSMYLGDVVALSGPDDILAIPGPLEPTQGSGTPFPNPGKAPGSAVVSVVYSTARAYDAATLLTAYDFAPGKSLAAMRGTVRNFGATTTVSEVYHFFVRKAGTGANEQPGMPCTPPNFG